MELIPDGCETMESPPSCSRQPPDGDEFPDYHESPSSTKPMKEPSPPPTASVANSATALWKSSFLHRDQQSSFSVRDKIAIFSNASSNTAPTPGLTKTFRSTDNIFFSVEGQEDMKENNKTSLGDLESSKGNVVRPPRLHARSQSLVDISSTEQVTKKDRWSILAEQRQKSLSRLKGLVIPEKVVEIETPPGVDLPEIRSKADPAPTPHLPTAPISSPATTTVLTASLWSPPAPSLPKYSPAFKRKSLQLYTTRDAPEVFTSTLELPPSTKPVGDIVSQKKAAENNDAPKSLESITSPTRSDCSFEFLTETKGAQKQVECKLEIRPSRNEEDSDNDSAVSSSQSSYISRTSPPPSPSHFVAHAESDTLHFRPQNQSGGKFDIANHRLLKAQSVEAINRQNILASAKCRSGRDLKIGSPLIQRKFEEEEELAQPEPEVQTNEDLSTDVGVEEVDSIELITNGINKTISNTDENSEPQVEKHKERVTESKSVYLRNVQKDDVPRRTTSGLLSRNSRAASVTDLRKSFELMGQNTPVKTKEVSPSATSRTSTNSLVVKKFSAIEKDQVTTQPVKPQATLGFQVSKLRYSRINFILELVIHLLILTSTRISCNSPSIRFFILKYPVLRWSALISNTLFVLIIIHPPIHNCVKSLRNLFLGTILHLRLTKCNKTFYYLLIYACIYAFISGTFLYSIISLFCTPKFIFR